MRDENGLLARMERRVRGKVAVVKRGDGGRGAGIGGIFWTNS